MRWLIRDSRWASEIGGEHVTVTAVGRPTAAGSMRDFWFRFASTAGSATVSYTVHRSRADARANDNAIASGTFSLGTAGSETVTNLTPGPDVTGLTFDYDASSATDEEVRSVCGYTAAPDLVILDDACEVLAEYAITGGALEGYSSATIRVGDPGTHVPNKYIYAVTEGIAIGSAGDTRSLGRSNFTLRFQAMRSDLVAGDDAGELEALSRRLRATQATLFSILTDERRTLDGLVPQGGYLAGFEGPAFLADQYAHWMGAAVLVRYNLPALRSDYTE